MIKDEAQPAQQEPVEVQLRVGDSYWIKPPPAQRKQLTVDCIGLALDLEAQARRVESQTVERAMLAAANGLRNIEAAHDIKENT